MAVYEKEEVLPLEGVTVLWREAEEERVAADAALREVLSLLGLDGSGGKAMTPLGPEHHRRSIRLRGYDYTQPGAYFVTICTHARVLLFGRVVDGEMVLNPYGEIVRDEWFRSAEIRDEIELFPDEFVVMPNHIHGIVWIVATDDMVGATGRSPLHAIRRYIAENPLRWHLDRYNPDATGPDPQARGLGRMLQTDARAHPHDHRHCRSETSPCPKNPDHPKPGDNQVAQP